MRLRNNPAITLFCSIGLVTVLIFAIYTHLMSLGHTIQIEATERAFSVYSNGALINKAPRTEVMEEKLSFEITTNRDDIFDSYLYKKPKVILLDKAGGKELSMKRREQASSIGSLFGPQRPLITGLVQYSDEGRAIEGSLNRGIKSFWLQIDANNLSRVNLSYGKMQVFLRPDWHHENLIATSGRSYVGDPIGLTSRRLLKRLLLQVVLVLSFSIFLLTCAIVIGMWWRLAIMLRRKTVLPTRIPSIITSMYASFKHILLSVPTQILKNILGYLFLFLILSIFMYVVVDTAKNTLGAMPHSQDEVSYIFQSKILAKGHLFLTSLPGDVRRFVDHEFILNNGKWFSMYTLGWPLLLGIGQLARLPYLVNPLISICSLILFFFLTKRYVGLLGAGASAILFGLSPFVILQSSGFLSHATVQLCLLVALWGFLHRKPIGMGVSLGFLFLTRPYEGVAFMLIFVMASVLALVMQKKSSRVNTRLLQVVLRHIILIVIPFLAFVGFQLFHNTLLSGHALTLPVNLYSPSTGVGFGMRGVEWGTEFTPLHGLENTLFNLMSFLDMSFLVPGFLYVGFIPFSYLLGKPRERVLQRALLMLSLSAIGMYIPYYAIGTLYGPRFWYVSAFALLGLSALGVIGYRRLLSNFIPPVASTIATALLLLLYGLYSMTLLPRVIGQFNDYNGIGSVTVRNYPKKPAVVFVDGSSSWQSYAQYFSSMSPTLDDEVIYLLRNGQSNIRNEKSYDDSVAKRYFTGRHVYYLNQMEK